MIPLTRGRKFTISPSLRFFLLGVALSLSAVPLCAQTFVAIDAPDAGQRKNQGTFPTCINEDGVIAGYYVDSANRTHAFFRSNSGVITEFDPLGLVNNYVSAINHAGAIVGNGHPGNGTQGFLRNPDGTFLSISPAGARYTFPSSINDSGEITGSFSDAKGGHGFVLDISGNLTVFNGPNAPNTGGVGINAAARWQECTQNLVRESKSVSFAIGSAT